MRRFGRRGNRGAGAERGASRRFAGRRAGGRLRAWWDRLPIMRAFFCYALAWLVVATVLSITTIWAVMEVYYAYDARVRSDRVEVNAGPYVYDAARDELVPATQMYLNETYDQVVFVGFADAAVSAEQGATIIVGGWDDGTPMVYATMDLLREDASLAISDWGGNFTEQDYRDTDGSPYDEEATVAIDELAAYDARERSERVRTDQLFRSDGLGESVVVSNVGYYVHRTAAATETPVGLGLRIAAGLCPFVLFGVLGIAVFRRFYRRRIARPLDVLGAAAERIAAQDLDFTVGDVEGRELGRLAQTMEVMRASLLDAQRELWRTAEDRRRLNAAFAHDLRTPVTVLKGTIEMVRMRAGLPRAGAADAGLPSPAPGRGASDAAPPALPEAVEVPCATVETLAAQVNRLKAYATAMTGLTKLEDRAVTRVEVPAASVCEVLRAQVEELARTRGVERGIVLAIEPGAACAAGGSAELDREAASGDEARDAVRDDVGDGGAPEHGGAPARSLPEPILAVDLPLVSEVLGNVVSNAVEHARAAVTVSIELSRSSERPRATPAAVRGDGAPEGRATWDASRGARCDEGGWFLVLAVADDGPGFSPEALRRGCEPFYSEQKSAQHVGLGLNIVQTLTRLHGGELVMENGPDGGARVRASFAVACGEDGAAQR